MNPASHLIVMLSNKVNWHCPLNTWVIPVQLAAALHRAHLSCKASHRLINIMEATASSASLYTLRGSYEYPDKSQKPQCYLWHLSRDLHSDTYSLAIIIWRAKNCPHMHPRHPSYGAQAGAEWLTGFILNSDQNLKMYLLTVSVALFINLITSPLS